MSKDNGGPAFPANEVTVHNVDIVAYAEPGMSLRDYFAAKALAACVTGYEAYRYECEIERAARDAYRIADAMLAERAK